MNGLECGRKESEPQLLPRICRDVEEADGCFTGRPFLSDDFRELLWVAQRTKAYKSALWCESPDVKI